jgi:hypothetical protein
MNFSGVFHEINISTFLHFFLGLAPFDPQRFADIITNMKNCNCCTISLI